MYEAEAGSSSNASQVDYASLQECNVLWATSLPAESDWCADELDGLEPGTRHVDFCEDVSLMLNRSAVDRRRRSIGPACCPTFL